MYVWCKHTHIRDILIYLIKIVVQLIWISSLLYRDIEKILLGSWGWQKWSVKVPELISVINLRIEIGETDIKKVGTIAFCNENIFLVESA